MYLFHISKLPVKENTGDNNIVIYNIIFLVKRGYKKLMPIPPQTK